MARNRLTLLKIVQRTLDTLGSDSVTSITETIEAQRIAEEARVTFYEMMSRDEWPHLIQPTQLEALADTDHPNYLKIPENVVRIHDFKYETTEDGDVQREFTTLCYLEPKEFMDLVHNRNSDENNVETITEFSGIDMFIINDQPPTHYTTFDDEYLITDSYDSDVDDTLQESKSVVFAKIMPDWEVTDDFIPDMPDQMFDTYIAEVAAACATYLKQTASPKDEMRARRGMAKLRRMAAKVDEKNTKARFGRKRSRFTGSMDGTRGSINAQYWP